MRRMIVTMASAALLATPLAAAPLVSAPLAAADTTWTGGTHRQAIDFVIQRALSQRGVPFVYGGGNANGPSLPPASVTTAAAPVAQPAPQVGLQPMGVAQPAAAPQTNAIIPGLSGLFGQSPTASAITPAPTTPGFDASGLVQYAFAGVGIKLPHYSGSQYNAGRKIPSSQMRRGDVIFYGPGGSQHVTLYLGNGQMLEAPYTGSQVKISPVRTSGMTPYVVRYIEY